MTRIRYKQTEIYRILFLLLVTAFITALGIIFLSIDGGKGLADAVAYRQEASGVASPVTAVLLNFRGYDTLLEVVVLLLAVVGAWSLVHAPLPRMAADISPVQLGLVRLLAPLMCLVAAYLVWQGSHLAGGAFQGGAILGAAGVLMLVTEFSWLRSVATLSLRIGLVFGPMTFIVVALCSLAISGNLLGYPERAAGALILLIELTCAISVGLTLALLFAGDRPQGEIPEQRGESGNGVR